MDITDTVDTDIVDTDTVDTTEERGPLMPNPRLMPLLMLTTVTTAMDTVMAVTMVDTTDTPTVTSERDLLMLNPKLKPNLKLMPPPGTDTTVDTTVIPTDTDMLVPTDTMAVTGGKLSTINSHFV